MPEEPTPVVINEINRFSTLPGGGDTRREWLELFNASDAAVDIGGMSISNDPSSPRLAVLPDGAVMAPRSHLVVLTDGGDVLEGDSAPPHVVVDMPWAQFRGEFGALRCRERGDLLLYERVDRGSCLGDRFTFVFPDADDRCDSTSLGRLPDGSVDVMILPRPTPGAPNDAAAESHFVRGDATVNGEVNISDAISLLRFLFSGEGDHPCPDALDADDSGVVNVTDAVFLLTYLFGSGAPPAPPFPAAGVDPTADSLACML
jgi:hypothetical protein